MFTGIIQEVGSIKRKTLLKNHVVTFEIGTKKIKPKLGDSIAVNGACLTVTKKTNTSFFVDVIPETAELTNLPLQKAGNYVNLESSLKMSDFFDGHFVTGHIDGVGKIIKRDDILKITFPKQLTPFISKKGSITINGISLTVVGVKKNNCTIALIPFTLKNTNLRYLKHGDLVNIEVDIIARYLYQIIKSR